MAGILLLVAFKLWLVHTELIYGSATEFDALWFVNAAKHWYWGADYSWTAFIRPPAYPLFIASVHFLKIPLRIAIELMQATGYAVLIAGLRKAGVPRWVCFLSFAAMILHPGSFHLNSVTMADNFYAAILPLALGGLLLTLFTARLVHATWTGIALALLWNTREESILIPPLIAVFLLVALYRQQRLVTESWRMAIPYWLGPAAAMVGTLLLLNAAVLTANYRAFQSLSKSELDAPSFRAAFKALLRIKPDRDLRYVSFSKDSLQKAYSVSPTFARLRPQLEGELGRNWQGPAFSEIGLHEIGAPWSLWALRHAANTLGLHQSASSANHFYWDVAREINRACDENRVPHRFVISSLIDPGSVAHIPSMPQSLVRMAALFVLQYQTIGGRDDEILTVPQRALYDEMTSRAPAGSAGPSGISAMVENIIGRYHRVLVIALTVAGILAMLTIPWRFRWLEASNGVNAALILLGTAISLRVLLFTYLDATWWVGGYDRYLFPVLPIYSCFLIVLIYQALALRRQARPRLAPTGRDCYNA